MSSIKFKNLISIIYTNIIGSGKATNVTQIQDLNIQKISFHLYSTSLINKIGFTINRLDVIMEGKLDLVIQELINADQKEKLEAEIK